MSQWWHNLAMTSALLVITKHRVHPHEMSTWTQSAKVAIAPLAACAGCLGVEIGLATDEADLAVVVSKWENVGAYRRALSNFEVKMHSIPFLSTAMDESSAFELIYQNVSGQIKEFDAARALDADEIGLGEAAQEKSTDRLGN